jgi:hypothetical protein
MSQLERIELILRREASAAHARGDTRIANTLLNISNEIGWEVVNAKTQQEAEIDTARDIARASLGAEAPRAEVENGGSA